MGDPTGSVCALTLRARLHHTSYNTPCVYAYAVYPLRGDQHPSAAAIILIGRARLDAHYTYYYKKNNIAAVSAVV